MYQSICIILSIILLIIYKYKNNQDIELSDIISMGFVAGGMIPPAIKIILYAFFPKKIHSIDDIKPILIICGIIVLFVALTSIKKIIS